MKTKLTLKILSLVLILGITIISCKKDAITVDTEKRFVQQNVAPVTDPMGGVMTLTLKPGDVADLNPGGDIVYRGSYNISGKKITVKIADMDWKFRFTIVSDNEVHGQDGQVLKLQP